MLRNKNTAIANLDTDQYAKQKQCIFLNCDVQKPQCNNNVIRIQMLGGLTGEAPQHRTDGLYNLSSLQFYDPFTRNKSALGSKKDKQ